MSSIKERTIGPINGLVILGGGLLLRKVALWALDQKLQLKVVTSPRHAEEKDNDQTLKEFLDGNGVDYSVARSSRELYGKNVIPGKEGFLFLSLGAAWIFDARNLEDLFSNRLLNLHGTRLPQNRGGGGFSWQIMMGNKFGYCLLHKVDEGIDTGDIVAAEEFIYPASLRIPHEFEEEYNRRNFDFITKFIEKHRNQSLVVSPQKQSSWFSSYWPRLSTEINGYVDWSLSPEHIERFICAFDSPYRGASSFLNGQRVFIKKVSLSGSDQGFHPFQRGLIYRKTSDWVCVSLDGATLVVQDIRDEDGDSIMQQVQIGDRLVTPTPYLEKSLQRVAFSPNGIV